MAVPSQHKLGPLFWRKVLLVGGLYVVVQCTMLLVVTAGWAKYAVLPAAETSQYWDAGIYAQLAIAPQCTAFYPLWPWLIGTLGNPATPAQALRLAITGSAVLFLASLPLALLTFEKIIQQRSIAFLTFFLYALGPNAIFHTIGYTESLFSVMSWGWLWVVAAIEVRSPSNRLVTGWRYCLLFGLTVGMSLARPILVPALAAIALVLGLTTLMGLADGQNLRMRPSQSAWQLGQKLRLAGVVSSACVVGYGVYGHYCGQTVGDFWAPFHAQVAWGRTLGLRPWLLLLPRSLLIDLHGLYLPALLLVAILWLLWAALQSRLYLKLYLPRSPWLYGLLVHPLIFTVSFWGWRRWAQTRTKAIQIPVLPDWRSYLGRFSVLFAIAFCSIHSAINLLANTGNLYSTSRHVFGTPFAFVGIGVLLAALNLPLLNRVAWGTAIVGVGLLAEQWLGYATNGWLG